MSAAVLTASPAELDSIPLQNEEGVTLADDRDVLSGLRFLIVLAARWEACTWLDSKCRAELRTELKNMRSLYFEKVDEIAMRFGIQQAMQAQYDVEHTVQIPHGMVPASAPYSDEKLHF